MEDNQIVEAVVAKVGDLKNGEYVLCQHAIFIFCEFSSRF
jgi:hypothetical protein